MNQAANISGASSSQINILVLFDSMSGNTARMAELIEEGARMDGVSVRRLHIDAAKAGDVLEAHGIAVGSPTNMGLMSWKMKRFWDVDMAPHWLQLDGRIGCAFSSAGGWGGGMELACQSILTVLMNFGMLAFGVPDYAGADKTAHYGAVTAKEPRGEHDMEVCRILGRRLSELTLMLHAGQSDRCPSRLPRSTRLPGEK